MEKIIVKGENGYDILIERGLLENAGEQIRDNRHECCKAVW